MVMVAFREPKTFRATTTSTREKRFSFEVQPGSKPGRGGEAEPKWAVKVAAETFKHNNALPHSRRSQSVPPLCSSARERDWPTITSNYDNNILGHQSRPRAHSMTFPKTKGFYEFPNVNTGGVDAFEAFPLCATSSNPGAPVGTDADSGGSSNSNNNSAKAIEDNGITDQFTSIIISSQYSQSSQEFQLSRSFQPTHSRVSSQETKVNSPYAYPTDLHLGNSDSKTATEELSSDAEDIINYKYNYNHVSSYSNTEFVHRSSSLSHTRSGCNRLTSQAITQSKEIELKLNSLKEKVNSAFAILAASASSPSSFQSTASPPYTAPNATTRSGTDCHSTSQKALFPPHIKQTSHFDRHGYFGYSNNQPDHAQPIPRAKPEPTIYASKGELPHPSFVYLRDTTPQRSGRQFRVDHRTIWEMTVNRNKPRTPGSAVEWDRDKDPYGLTLSSRTDMQDVHDSSTSRRLANGKVKRARFKTRVSAASL
jgi:hypothetical protein